MAIAAELGQLEPGIVIAPALGELTIEEERQREIPARMRKVGGDRERAPERVDGGANFVLRLQREPEIVPCGGVVGLERERGTIRGNRFVLTVRGGEHQPQIVVKFRLCGLYGDRALEQRQSSRDLAALVVDHAQEVQRERVARL